MRRRLTAFTLALLILLLSMLYYRYTAEGYEDVKDEKTKKAEEDAKAAKAIQDAKDSLNRNKKNLMEYSRYILILGQVVDPTTKAGTAVELATVTMSGGALSIKDKSPEMAKRIEAVNQAFSEYLSVDMMKNKQCGIAEGLFSKMAYSKLDDIGRALVELSKKMPNDILQMDAAGIRTFLYTIKDALATSTEAAQAYNTLKESDVKEIDLAEKALFCKMPTLLLESTRKALKGTKC